MPGTPQKPRVLVVDDDPGSLLFASSVLMRAGLDVHEAPGPYEALAIAESIPGPLDVAVLDQMMPRMDGNDLARELRRRFPDVRIVFLTAYASRVQSIADAVVLEKPVTRGVLEQAVLKATRER